MEQLVELLRLFGLSLELYQLTTGCCSGDVLPLGCERVQMVRIRLDRPLLVMGPKSSERLQLCLSLGPLRPGLVGLQSHGVELADDVIYGLDPQRDVHLVTPDAYGMALLSIDSHHLFTSAEAMGFPCFESVFRKHDWLRLEPGRLQELRRFLAELFAAVEAGVGPAAALAAEAPLISPQADLLPLLLETILDGWERQRGVPREPPRIELVKLAEQWAQQHPSTPITLEELCREVYVSRRSLIRGFQEHLGMGPMAFLKLRRLHGVRRQLLDHPPATGRVGELAHAWGFPNSGNFARDYTRLFGESPSQTLKRTPL